MGYIKKIEHLKNEFPDAYFKLEVVKWRTFEDEVYKNTNEGTLLTWERKTACEAIFFIYGNQEARINRVAPLNQVAIPFEFDMHSKLNILQQAYKALSKMEEFSGGTAIFEDKLILN